jgi:hypothetical protein
MISEIALAISPHISSSNTTFENLIWQNMTTAKGTYAYCGKSNFTLTLTCSGTNCTQLKGVLGLTCSNGTSGVKCSNKRDLPWHFKHDIDFLDLTA